MPTLLEREREKYAEMWSAVEPYAQYSPGEQYTDLFLEMARPDPRHVILDAGCGAGKGALALQARDFRHLILCDLTRDGLTEAARALPFVRAPLWTDLRRQQLHCDWVYCCDVLEHVPPAFTMLAVARLLEVARRGVFLSIALVPDRFGLWIGQSLHQTVQPFTTWRDQLRELGTVVECRDLLQVGLYVVKP